MLRVLLICLALFSLSFTVSGQAIMRGKITDQTSKAGVGYSGIYLLRDSIMVKSTLTDSAGNFELTGVQLGTYRFQVSSIQHEPFSMSVTVKEAGNIVNLGELFLKPGSKMLNEVVVRGEKTAIQYHSDKLVLNIAGNSFFKAAASASDILRKAPGIIENPDGTLLMSGQNTPVFFVDGKPTTMNAEEVRAYLNALSPDLIESIELITNPSARYDGQYKAIIDIRLKKDASLGWKGNAAINFRVNMYAWLDNNLQLQLKTKKIAYTFRAGYTVGNDYHLYRAFQHQANNNYMATDTRDRTYNNNITLQGGIEYQVDKSQRIDIAFRSFNANRNLDAYNTLTFTDSTNANLIGKRGNHNIATPIQRNNSVSLGYELTLGKSKFNLLGNFAKAESRRKEDIQNRDRISNDLMSYWKTDLKNDVTIRNVQADYTQPLTGGTIDAGAKFGYITTDNDLRYDTLTKNNEFEIDDSRTNRFLYEEYVTAAYVSYSRRIKKFDIRVSLRAEHTHTVANAVTQKEVLKRDYLTWLPGIGINYAISSNQRINVSFNRRMTRPGFDQLNPFRFYLSPLNYWVGNPYLKPSVTSIFNISYSYKNLNVSVNAGRESDYLTRYPQYNKVTNELLYLGTNLPHNDFLNLESSYTLTFTKWWKTIHSGGIYYNKQLMPYFGETFEIGVTDFSISGSHIFTLPKGFLLDFSYKYRSKTGSSLYKIKATGSIDAGLQKNWLQGKLSTKLNFYDIFDTYKVALEFRHKYIMDNQLMHRFGTQRGMLSIAYNFGRSNYKARQRSASEEEGRVNN